MCLEEALRKDTFYTKIKDYKRNLQFASINLQDVDVSPTPNISLYNALTYLARIDELNIYLPSYENLQNPPKCLDKDEAVYLYTVGKCNELNRLIQTITAGEFRDAESC